MQRRLVTAFVTAFVAVVPASAAAGGFEIPDNGTEALGRGAAFTAKADDGTALQYNIAGFARQRGTRLLVNTNLWVSDYSFARSGTYPDDPANSFSLCSVDRKESQRRDGHHPSC